MFYRYDSVFPFIHKCKESEASFCDMEQLKIERAKVSMETCPHHIRGEQCIWGIRGCCKDTSCTNRPELRKSKKSNWPGMNLKWEGSPGLD